MIITIFDVFGYLGSITYAFVLVPHAIKVYYYKDINSLNNNHLIIQFISNTCGVIYSVGLLRENDFVTIFPILFANMFCMVVNIFIFFVIYLYIKQTK